MNLINLKPLALLLTLFMCSTSCSKVDSEEMASENELDIYFAGYGVDPTTKQSVGVIWKNGAVHQIITGDPISHGTSSVNLHSLWVEGRDVYVGGEQRIDAFPPQQNVIKLWKNGESLHDFPSNYSGAVTYISATNKTIEYVTYTSINDERFSRQFQIWRDGVIVKYIQTNDFPYGALKLSGDDLYTLTTEKQTDETYVDRYSACVRKNDKIHFLLPTIHNIRYASEFNAIQITGNDIYTAGYSATIDGKEVATIWKNGEEMYSLTKSESTNAVVNSIHITNNDIYAIGELVSNNRTTDAIVWKNGSPLYNLTNGAQSSSPTAVAAANGNVYTSVNESAGYGATRIVVYKNNLKLYVIEQGSTISNSLIILPRKSNNTSNK